MKPFLDLGGVFLDSIVRLCNMYFSDGIIDLWAELSMVFYVGVHKIDFIII